MKKSYGGHDPSTLVEAVVGKVCDDSYVVTYPTKNVGDLTRQDSVTFSLKYWQGTDAPQCAQVVMLVNPTWYARGWRSLEAYPIPHTTRFINRQ